MFPLEPSVLARHSEAGGYTVLTEISLLPGVHLDVNPQLINTEQQGTGTVV